MMTNIRATLGIACALQLSLLGCSSSDGDSEQTDRASAEDTDAGHRKADSGAAAKHVDAGDATDPSSDNRPAAAMGSGDGNKPSPTRSSADDGLITYERDIRPLLENNCIECHSEGGIGPGAFDDWASVQKLGAEIVSAVTGGIMPPWPASDDCHPIQDARSLPDATKALFAQWQMDGFLQGDEADYVAPEKKRRLDLGTPDLMFQGNEPYTPAVNGDSYRCFFAGAVSEDTYITALDIIPTDRAEVHHVILYKVDAQDIAAVQSEDDSAPGGGYPCNSAGVGGFVSSQNLFSYRPGGVTVVLNEGDAVYLKGGSGLVLQVHYNTQFLPAGTSPGPDQTGIHIWALPKGKTPDHIIFRTGILSPLNGNSNGTDGLTFMTSIPADAHTVGQMTLKMNNVSVLGPGLTTGAANGAFLPGEIVGMTPHAHAWATKMIASLTPSGGSEECLIDIPNWDYNWQLDYMFTTPVPYTANDVLHVECDYDNTDDHQPIVNGTKRSPQLLTFGESTLNEMCEHYLWLRFKYEDFKAANDASLF